MAAVAPVSEWRGHDGIRDFIAAIRAEFESYSTEILECRWHGDRLLVRATNTVGTRTVDQPLESHVGQVIEFREGLMTRVVQTDDPPPGWDEAEAADS